MNLPLRLTRWISRHGRTLNRLDAVLDRAMRCLDPTVGGRRHRKADPGELDLDRIPRPTRYGPRRPLPAAAAAPRTSEVLAGGYLDSDDAAMAPLTMEEISRRAAPLVPDAMRVGERNSRRDAAAEWTSEPAAYESSVVDRRAQQQQQPRRAKLTNPNHKIPKIKICKPKGPHERHPWDAKGKRRRFEVEDEGLLHVGWEMRAKRTWALYAAERAAESDLYEKLYYDRSVFGHLGSIAEEEVEGEENVDGDAGTGLSDGWVTVPESGYDGEGWGSHWEEWIGRMEDGESVDREYVTVYQLRQSPSYFYY